MPRGNPKGTGRPKAVIDWDRVDKMLQAGCDGAEVAATLGIHPDTLYRACNDVYKVTFSAYAQEKKASGNQLLRMAQFGKALKGDTTMLIWLGKNRLKQADRPEEEEQEGPKEPKPFELRVVLPGGAAVVAGGYADLKKTLQETTNQNPHEFSADNPEPGASPAPQ